jgi:hypothetical protein
MKFDFGALQRPASVSALFDLSDLEIAFGLLLLASLFEV